MLGKSSSNSSGLLGSEILGGVLLALVELTELVSLGEVDNGQNLGDGSSNVTNSSVSEGVGNLLDSQLLKFLLEVDKLLLELSLGLLSEFDSLNLGLNFVSFQS